MTRRERLTGTAVAVTIAVAAAGCTQGSATRVDSDSDVTPITMWRAFNSDSDREYFETNFIEPFNAEHPETPVQLTVRDWPNLERLQRTAMASGSGPDLVYTSGPSYALDYIDAGQLLPLDDFVEQYGWDEKIQSWALETGKVDGRLYILPVTYESMIMLYNPQTFAENGWQVPTTRAELEEIFADAESKGMMPNAIGAGSWAATSEHLVTIAFNHVAGPTAVYEALEGDRPFTDPAFHEAITVLADWFQKGWMGGSVENYFTNTEPELYTKLASGDAAVYTVGSWSFEHVKKYFGEAAGNDADWAWAPLPSLSADVQEGLFDIGIGETLSVNADTRHADAVAVYLDWLISNPAAQLTATATTGAAPMPLEYQDADYPADMDERVQSLYRLLAEADDVGYTTWTFYPPKTDVYIYEQMDKVIAGQLSVEDYLSGLDEVFQEELADGAVPPRPVPADLEP